MSGKKEWFEERKRKEGKRKEKKGKRGKREEKGRK